MKKYLKRTTFRVLATPFGLLKEFLLKTGRIVLLHNHYLNMLIKRTLKTGAGFVILSNHPSLFETVIFVLLFWPVMLWYPSLTPISTPDEVNFTKGKLFGRFKFFAKIIMGVIPKISIPRGSRNAEKLNEVHDNMKRKMEKKRGRVMVIFPEGGRTGKEKDGTRILSSGHRKIRKFQKGILRLVRKSEKDFYILPTYIEGAENILPIHGKVPRLWKRMRIFFGRPINTKDLRKKTDVEIMEILQNAVLNA